MKFLFTLTPTSRLVAGFLLTAMVLVYAPNAIGAAKTPVSNLHQTAEFTVTGQITDATTKEALIGTTVVVKGTAIGTATDASGNFSINVPDQKSILVFEFIGYERQEIEVGSQTVINVTMKSNSLELSQVLVVGYGSTTKKEMTGSAKSIKNDDFNKGIINSPEQLLQGKVAGVNVVSATGEPGSTQSITVRGPGGVRTGSTPLFVLDGLPLDNSSTGGATNPLTFLNPQDIESIDVLKDASATAIYGSRGANGVILITTKKGKAGFSSITYTGSMGISTLARPLKVFSADEYRTQVPAVGGVLDDLQGNTNWQKEITRTAMTKNHNLSLGGGAGKLTYYGSFGLQQQQGIIKGNNLNLYTGRLNVSQKFLDDRLTVDVNLNAASTVNQRPPIGDMIGGAISANPTYPAYDPTTGEPYRYQAGTNPLLAQTLTKDITNINRIIGNISPSLTIMKGLVYKINFGIDNSTSTRDLESVANAVPKQDGRLESVYSINRNRLIENFLTYSMKNANHGLTVLAGHSYQKIFLQGRAFSINKFPISDIDPIYNPGLGQDLTLANNKPSGYALINELQSFYSRVNYQFREKYLLTATVRADGSSKFGKNNKYGVFPSVSAGWRISQEAFMKNGPFSELKLRAGWGQTGNQEIPSKITQALFTSVVSPLTSYPLADSGPFPAGTTFTRLANPDIQWEVSTQVDLGLDFALLKGALSGSIDYFNKVSNKILLEVIPADPVQPASSIWTNVKDMTITNQGLELDLNYRYATASGFKLDLGGNLTFIKNVVKNSPYTVIPSGSASGSGLTSATINGYVNNQPIGTFYLREFTGFDEKGLSTYRDTDGDGVVSDKDRISAGSALPKQMYNFFTTLSYKGFSLRVNFNGVSGNKIYDNTANTNFYKLRLSKGINTTKEAVTFPNESINNAAPVSTRYLKNGAFLRLNNLSLNYAFNTQALGINKYVKGLNLTVTGQNLWLITKYNGFDPEVNNDRSINGISSYGIDYLSYPKAKSIIFGLTATF